MATSVPNLILVRDNHPVGTFFVSPEKETSLGRSSGNLILLSDERCSRQHAVVYQKNELWYLRDLQSSNGTAINDRLLSPGEEVVIKSGDRIQMGYETLYFCETELTGAELDEGSDFRRSLSVSKTLAAAVSCIGDQQELTARLNQVRTENQHLQALLKLQSELVGDSPAMQKVNLMMSKVASSKATVLIRGESGVGKELVARAIHNSSPRQKSPMICLNCAVVSETLLASELFGHEKGAFTGATERKMGKFELADGGTLFLDEIAEMGPGLQAKFLRVLEGHPFERVGGNKPIKVDVRVLAATNRELETEVAEGRFRHDLFFRLRVLEISVPPLRKRPEDISLLADFFLKRFADETGQKFDGFSRESHRILQDYRWPGNVRELKNVIERAVLLANDSIIMPDDLLLSTIQTTGQTNHYMITPPVEAFAAKVPVSETDLSSAAPFHPVTLDEAEKLLIVKTLEHYNWNKSHSAKSLGIERTTLDRKIARYELQRSPQDE